MRENRSRIIIFFEPQVRRNDVKTRLNDDGRRDWRLHADEQVRLKYTIGTSFCNWSSENSCKLDSLKYVSLLRPTSRTGSRPSSGAGGRGNGDGGNGVGRKDNIQLFKIRT